MYDKKVFIILDTIKCVYSLELSNIEAPIENRSSCSERQGHSSSRDNQTTLFKRPIERYSQEFFHDKSNESTV